MKRLPVVISYLLPANILAWSQIETGTVIYLNLAEDEATIAADSRMTYSTGGHDDTECKISAFGNQFIFTMAGMVKGPGWNAHAVARQLWQADRTRSANSVLLIAKQWATRMETIYEQPILMRDISKRNLTTVASAFFVADYDGVLTGYALNIDAETRQSGMVRIWHDAPIPIPNGGSVSGGYDDIIQEFMAHRSDRAKAYLAQFISSLPQMATASDHRAALAAKFIEWSIQLSPKSNELSFPIDVAQLRRGTGVVWRSVKPNCQQK